MSLRRSFVAAVVALFIGAAAQAQVGPSPAEAAAYSGLHAAAWRGDVAAIEKGATADKKALEARDGNGRTPEGEDEWPALLRSLQD